MSYCLMVNLKTPHFLKTEFSPALGAMIANRRGAVFENSIRLPGDNVSNLLRL